MSTHNGEYNWDSFTPVFLNWNKRATNVGWREAGIRLPIGTRVLIYSKGLRYPEVDSFGIVTGHVLPRFWCISIPGTYEENYSVGYTVRVDSCDRDTSVPFWVVVPTLGQKIIDDVLGEGDE